MKIKTADLIDQTLDYAVAICRGKGIEFDCPSDPWLTVDGIADRPLHSYTPSTDWLIGGPIIDREGISIVQEAEYGWWQAAIKVQLGSMFGTDLCGSHRQEGPTALVAAMRCYCCAKLGEYVDIPEELCQQQNG